MRKTEANTQENVPGESTRLGEYERVANLKMGNKNMTTLYGQKTSTDKPCMLFISLIFIQSSIFFEFEIVEEEITHQ